MTKPQFDAIIIGGSAAGLSAAQALGRSLRSVLVIDGGLPRNRFAAHMHNVLGHDGTSPSELRARGKAEAEKYGVQFRDATVVSVREAGEAIEVQLDDGSRELSRGLVLATGIVDELPSVEGLAKHWGSSVLHCPYCHGWEVRGQRIGVLATSPMSMHQVKLLRQWSDQVVAFTHDLGPIDDETRERLAARGIELVPDRVIEVLGDGDRITAARTESGSEVALDAIFTAGTLRPRDEMVEGLHLDREQGPLGEVIAVDQTGRTSHPRVWAAGNVVAPAATVPQAMAAGVMAGAALNFALVELDFDLAVVAASAAATDDQAAGRIA